MNASDIDKSIDEIDLDLFSKIDSQTTAEDRKSLLAIERAVRKSGSYVYLEIGSYLGGTLQPHLLDPKCSKIYSIDNRPPIIDDVRGERQVYQNNSTEKMIASLSAVSPSEISKIVTFETDAVDVDPSMIDPKPDVCFIDGEHTDRAAVSDFQFCLKVAAPDCVIVFHDSNLVYNGIRNVISQLNEAKITHTDMKVGGSVFVIALGHSRVINDEYLVSLKQNLRFFFLKSSLLLWHRQNSIRRKNARKNETH